MANLEKEVRLSPWWIFFCCHAGSSFLEVSMSPLFAVEVGLDKTRSPTPPCSDGPGLEPHPSFLSRQSASRSLSSSTGNTRISSSAVFLSFSRSRFAFPRDADGCWSLLVRQRQLSDPPPWFPVRVARAAQTRCFIAFEVRSTSVPPLSPFLGHLAQTHLNSHAML